MTIQTSNLGFPRLGRKREWKKAIEGYWANKYDLETLQLSKLASIDRNVYDSVLGPADGVHGGLKSAGKMALWDNNCLLYTSPSPRD